MGQSNAEVAALAKQLGHTHQVIGETLSGRRWFFECSCGFGAPQRDGRPSRTYATMAVAVETAQWHLRKAVQESQRNAVKNGVGIAPRGRQIG